MNDPQTATHERRRPLRPWALLLGAAGLACFALAGLVLAYGIGLALWWQAGFVVFAGITTLVMAGKESRK